MKIKSILSVFAALALVSCGGNKAKEAQVVEEPVQEAEEQVIPLAGKWQMLDYAGEEQPEDTSTAEYILTFSDTDNTFGMTTGCNNLGGEYKVNGDSLLFSNILATQMLCPDMKVEDAMKRILPIIDTYSITPDSILRLRSDARIYATFKAVK